MKSRNDIYQHVSKLIAEENGMLPVSPQDTLSDSGLDSLGMMFLFVSLDTFYNILEGIPVGQEIEELGLDTITIKELVNLCKKSLIVKSAEAEYTE